MIFTKLIPELNEFRICLQGVKESLTRFKPELNVYQELEIPIQSVRNPVHAHPIV